MRARLAGSLVAVLVAAAVGIAGIGTDIRSAYAACSLAPTTGSYNGYAGVEERFIGSRRYLLKVPAGVSTAKTPLLLVLHGLSHTPDNPLDYAPWETMADTEKFVLAYPDAGDGRWDHQRSSADVTFLRALIGSLKSSYCIDESHVHVTGDSMGAYMSQRMACDAAEVVASVGEYAGGDPTKFAAGICVPSEPVSLIMFHGTRDLVVPYSYGTEARDKWKARLSCPTPASTNLGDGLLLTYTPCAGGAELQWREYEAEGHASTWANKGTDMSTRQWAFFETHPL